MLKLLEKIEFKSKENKMRYIADTKIALDQYLSNLFFVQIYRLEK